MKNSRVGRLLAGLVLSVLIAGLFSYSETNVDLPNNFHEVGDGVYRSSQPDAKEMKTLDSMGFKVILNLRNYHDNIRKLRSTDIVQIHLPMRALDIEEHDVVSALRVLGKVDKPVLVHCRRGADRTGCVIAAYRMVYQDWSREKAIKEFRDEKYGYGEKMFPGILKFLEEVDIEVLKLKVFEK